MNIFLNLCLIFLATAATAFSQNYDLPVWPSGVPGEIRNPEYREDTVFSDSHAPRIQHVTSPRITVWLPTDSASAHAAVVICPGGGYHRLAIDHEGYDVARWLASQGIAGIVLKYRLPSDSIMTHKEAGPLQDVQEAIRIVRRSAAAWRIDPGKIGVMGFSAGGHLAGSASTLWQRYDTRPDSVSARPDFSILIYGVLSMQEELTHADSRRNLLGEHPSRDLVDLFSAERQVTAQTPPAFIVHSENDPTVNVGNSLRYFESLKRNGIPAEMHIFTTGTHGYGMGITGGTQAAWPGSCLRWLEVMHLR